LGVETATVGHQWGLMILPIGNGAIGWAVEWRWNWQGEEEVEEGDEE
jgi:hypothetical protein